MSAADPGWCPFATQHRGAASGPSGYPAGTRNQNEPLLFIDHRMGGYKRTLDDDQWRHDNFVGVHFGIGRDGSIDQYTNIFDASWGNGVSGSVPKYDRANKHLAALEQLGSWITVQYAGSTAYALVSGAENVINCHTISTEHEDEGIDQPWTPAMVDADERVKRWCLDELAIGARSPIVIDADALAGHFQIDAVNRPNCPGDNWPKDAILAALAGGDDMKIAPWWTNRKLDGKGEINLNTDFGPGAAYELCIVLNAGTIAFQHGDFKPAAVVAGKAATFMLVPGQFGTAPFSASQADIAYLACSGVIKP